MYCGECGTKLKKNDIFCGNCGTKVEQTTEAKESSSNSSSKQVVPKKPMSKSKKILFAICAVVVVVLVLGYQFLDKKYGPKGVAAEYIEALIHQDANALYDYLHLEGDTTFTSREQFEEIVRDSESNSSIQNYKIGEVVYGDGKLSARVKIHFTFKDTQMETTETIDLIKTKKKKYLFFDVWELNQNFDSVLVKDYQVKVPKNSEVSINKILLDKKYFDKKDSTTEWDVYKIPQIFKSEVDIISTIAGFEVEEKVVPSSFGYTASLELDSLSKEDKEKLEKQLMTDMTTIYQNLIEGKTWDSISDSYNFEGADLEELEETYQSLYEDVVNDEYRKLKKFEITSMKVNSLTSDDDGEIRIGVKLSYNYTIDYKKYDDSIEERTGKNSSNSILIYQFSGNKLRLIDASYLVSYFSAY